jgi:hypothetical protein
MRGVLLFAATIFVTLVSSSQSARSDSTTASVGSAGSSAGPTPPQAFAPVDPGPASALWHEESLTAQERAYIARARQAANDEEINAGYASATSELGERATHLAAAQQLGVEGLASEGVVP